MDFFARQKTARRNTALLVVYFAAAVVLIVAAVYLVFALTLNLQAESRGGLWHPQWFLGVVAGTLGVIGVGSAWKMVELRAGGSAVATMLGGRPVSLNPPDPEERKLRNVVEEMAIASGTPVPEIYLLEREPGINAFAAGHSTSDMAIGVTRGCMRLLNRDELQGVIGHEFSHILNGDMRLNLRLMGLIFGILCLAIIGRVLLRFGGRGRSGSGGRRGGNPLPLLGLGLLIIGSIGAFFGRLIQSAVSRQREFLADSAAVQFTRNPAGLAGALRKIGGLAMGSRLEAPNAGQASHLFFANGLRESWLGLMSTHPPLVERIRAIDPTFDGVFQPLRPEPSGPPPPLPATSAAAPAPAPRVVPPALSELRGAQAAALAGIPAAAPTVRAQQMVPRVGSPTAAHLVYAAHWRAALPEAVLAAAHEPAGACGLIYGLLLSAEEPLRRAQLNALEGVADLAVREETARLHPAVAALPVQARLPLVLLALPALRGLAPTQYLRFAQGLQLLIESDREISLFEFTLRKIATRHLDPFFQPPTRQVLQFYALKPLLPDCAVLLSGLARVGHDDPTEVARAFEAGAARLGEASRGLALLDAAQCDLAAISAGLDRLAFATPPIRQQVLEACAHAVASDNVLQPEEAELLRAVADALDCPMPPFIEGL